MRLLQKALTFDDVLLVPAYSNILPADTSLKTRLTRNISLNIPLLSAAMDTVTESRLAIAMAQEGGIGIIHKNLKPKDQAREVARVKRFEAGVLRDPITIPPDMVDGMAGLSETLLQELGYTRIVLNNQQLQGTLANGRASIVRSCGK